MAQPTNETTCIKCGGKMIQGRINIPVDRITTQTMPQLASGFEMRGLAGIEDFHATPKWEEKTGNKTGFIFKRDEVREMGLKGYRCSNCNYIELYARP